MMLQERGVMNEKEYKSKEHTVNGKCLNQYDGLAQLRESGSTIQAITGLQVSRHQHELSLVLALGLGGRHNFEVEQDRSIE
jgi:hypothetical protein